VKVEPVKSSTKEIRYRGVRKKKMADSVQKFETHRGKTIYG